MFEQRFGELYRPRVGRPGIPIRLMVGLSYLQHTFRLSDEEVVARWVENPYCAPFYPKYRERCPTRASVLTVHSDIRLRSR